MEWMAWDPATVLACLIAAAVLFTLNWFVAPRLIDKVIAKQRRVHAKRKAERAAAQRPSPSPRPAARHHRPAPAGRPQPTRAPVTVSTPAA